MYLVALFLVVLFGEVSSMPKKRERSSGRAGIGMKKKNPGHPSFLLNRGPNCWVHALKMSGGKDSKSARIIFYYPRE